MRSAMDFLPSSMTLFTTCWTRRERWTGSGSTGRIWAAARRGTALLPLDAVLRAGLLAVADAGGVERPADDLVAHAREILHAAAAHEHDGVLLQVVALAGDVRGDLHRVRQTDAGHLAQRGVRLLRRGRVDTGAHAPLLRRRDALLATLAGLQARRGQLLRLRVAALADQLGGRGHTARESSKGLESATQAAAASEGVEEVAVGLTGGLGDGLVGDLAVHDVDALGQARVLACGARDAGLRHVQDVR